MLKDRVTRGSALIAVGQLIVRLADVVAIVITARLLFPADFGIVALGSSTVMIAQSVTHFPVVDALIGRDSIDKTDTDAAFTLNLLRAVLLALAIVLAAHPIAGIYGDPRLVNTLYVLSVAVLAPGLISPGMVHFTRELNFKPQVLLQTLGKVTSVLVTIGLAVWLRSYWALIIGIVIMPVTITLFSYILSPYRLAFTLKNTSKLLHFAGWVTMANAFSTINLYGDRYFIGGYLGPDKLGQYYQASTIATTVTTNMVTPLSLPLFSAFSKLLHDDARLGNALLRGQYALALAIFPLAAFLAAESMLIVELVLGPKWKVAGTLLVWLFPAVALQALSVPIQSVILASGQTRYLAVREFIFLCIRLIPTILAAQYIGLLGAVIARTAVSPVLLIANFYLVQQTIRLSIVRQAHILLRPTLSAATVFAALHIVESRIDQPEGAVLIAVHLSAALLASVILYLATTLLLWKVSGMPEGPETTLLARLGAMK